MKIPTLRVLPLNQTIQVQLFSNFLGGVLYPPLTLMELILIYIRYLNWFYNCTTNQLGPPYLDGYI